jgi:hypothetical protein
MPFFSNGNLASTLAMSKVCINNFGWLFFAKYTPVSYAGLCMQMLGVIDLGYTRAKVLESMSPQMMSSPAAMLEKIEH